MTDSSEVLSDPSTESVAHLDRLNRQAHERTHARDGGKGTLVIDFDDTLTAQGGVEALQELRRRGYGLIISTSNADLEGIRAWLTARWTEGDPPFVTDFKPQALAYIDDKAVPFTSWSEILERFR